MPIFKYGPAWIVNMPKTTDAAANMAAVVMVLTCFNSA